MKNKYPGKCINCGREILPLKGLLVKLPKGGWGVKHAVDCWETNVDPVTCSLCGIRLAPGAAAKREAVDPFGITTEWICRSAKECLIRRAGSVPAPGQLSMAFPPKED